MSTQAVETKPVSRIEYFFSQISESRATISILAIITSLVAGGLFVAFSDEDVHTALGYFFSNPLPALQAIWDAMAGTFIALFRGSVYNFNANNFNLGIRALTETVTFATPLMVAGLGLAVSFRAGLFNIGGFGQIIMGVICAAWVGFTFQLPIWLHLPLAVISGVFGGALYGGLVGYLKAKTGANEVILTIMLNYIATYFLAWLLTVPGFQQPNTSNPLSAPVAITSMYPNIFGNPHRIHYGVFIALAMVLFIWWLFSRSTRGFQFRAIGLNQHAAKLAGMNVKRNFVYVMAISGGLMGLAGTMLVLGTERFVAGGIAGSYGFDAITVALLGRNKPVGVVLAALLMGALRAGSGTMQAAEGIPVDIVALVQSMIVLFIAAPPLVRTIFRLPQSKQVEA